MIKKIFAICAISLSLLASDLPEPYCHLEKVLPFDPQGWYNNASQIEWLFQDNKIETVIEVGSWLGKSTRHIAELLPPTGKLYAIDHWLGSYEHQTQEMWTSYLPTLYDQFLSNVIHAGLTDKIIPIRMASLDAARFLMVSPDLIYIDASHDYMSVYLDLVTWYPFVEEHGILCGDDCGWKSVRKAVRRFAKENGLKIDASGNFWRLKTARR
jgi:predicted O-methyltransferase YrrM